MGRPISTDTNKFVSKDVRECSSELLYFHKHFIALSSIIKMAKSSENENFSSGTTSYRFIILPQRSWIEPFLQPKSYFYFQNRKYFSFSLAMCSETILRRTSASNISTRKHSVTLARVFPEFH